MVKKKLKIAIVRALDVRIIQADYAVNFKKFTPIFITDEKNEVTRFLEQKKVEVRYVPMVGPIFGKSIHKHKSLRWFEEKDLENALKDCNIVQIQDPFFPYALGVVRAARKQAKLIVATPTMTFNHPSAFIPPYSFMTREVVKNIDLFIMRTKKVNDYLDLFDVPKSKRVLIYHGVNTERFYPTSRNTESVSSRIEVKRFSLRRDSAPDEAWGEDTPTVRSRELHPIKKREDDTIRILFVGQLYQWKGIDDLLAVFPEIIKRSNKKVELIICGKWGMEERIREMVNNYPIIHKNFISNLDLPKIYNAADIFCAPSKANKIFGVKLWEENIGFVFLEAMASGLPIITNDCGSIREIVGSDNIINEQGDKKALLESLLILINDNKLRRTIGLNNWKRVEREFDMGKQVEKEEKAIYEKIG